MLACFLCTNTTHAFTAVTAVLFSHLQLQLHMSVIWSNHSHAFIDAKVNALLPFSLSFKTIFVV